jgi:energy-coupling factor transporter ATP-binding protein EcfA2
MEFRTISRGKEAIWVSVDIGLNLLYGLNGSGKSTVLSGIRTLFDDSPEVEMRVKTWSTSDWSEPGRVSLSQDQQPMVLISNHEDPSTLRLGWDAIKGELAEYVYGVAQTPPPDLEKQELSAREFLNRLSKNMGPNSPSRFSEPFDWLNPESQEHGLLNFDDLDRSEQNSDDENSFEEAREELNHRLSIWNDAFELVLSQIRDINFNKAPLSESSALQILIDLRAVLASDYCDCLDNAFTIFAYEFRRLEQPLVIWNIFNLDHPEEETGSSSTSALYGLCSDAESQADQTHFEDLFERATRVLVDDQKSADWTIENARNEIDSNGLWLISSPRFAVRDGELLIDEIFELSIIFGRSADSIITHATWIDSDAQGYVVLPCLVGEYLNMAKAPMIRDAYSNLFEPNELSPTVSYIIKSMGFRFVDPEHLVWYPHSSIWLGSGGRLPLSHNEPVVMPWNTHDRPVGEFALIKLPTRRQCPIDFLEVGEPGYLQNWIKDVLSKSLESSSLHSSTEKSGNDQAGRLEVLVVSSGFDEGDGRTDEVTGDFYPYVRKARVEIAFTPSPHHQLVLQTASRWLRHVGVGVTEISLVAVTSAKRVLTTGVIELRAIVPGVEGSLHLDMLSPTQQNLVSLFLMMAESSIGTKGNSWSQANWYSKPKKFKRLGTPIPESTERSRMPLKSEELENTLGFQPNHRTSLLLLDEPETGLHVQASSRLFEVLANNDSVVSLVATHSPAAFDGGGQHLLHLNYESAAKVTIDALTFSELSQWMEVNDFGVRPSDLLVSKDLILYCEGQHDLAVLRLLLNEIGSHHLASRVVIQPMGGYHNFSGLTSSGNPLISMSDATIAIMLDHTRSKYLQSVYQEAITLLGDGGVKAATRWLSKQRINARDNHLSGEEEKVLSLLEDASRSNTLNRVQIISFPELDIAESIPATCFGLNSPWEEFRSAHRNSKDSRQPFKEWLKTETGVAITVNSIEKAFSKMDSVPTSLTSIIEQIELILLGKDLDRLV